MAKFPELDSYGEHTLLALGVLALRSSLLDETIVYFFCAVLKHGPGQPQPMDFMLAHSLLYSTRNAKARSDMIRAIISLNHMSPARRAFTLKLLDRFDRLSSRRNELIHGKLKFEQVVENPKQILVNYYPAAAGRIESRPLAAKEIESLAEDYEHLRVAIWNFCGDVLPREPRVPPLHGTPD